MTKQKYEVVIEETRTYRIEVLAESEEQAEELAFQSHDFASDNFKDTDSQVIEIGNLGEVEEEEE